jgi:hypothetical protein
MTIAQRSAKTVCKVVLGMMLTRSSCNAEWWWYIVVSNVQEGQRETNDATVALVAGILMTDTAKDSRSIK